MDEGLGEKRVKKQPDEKRVRPSERTYSRRVSLVGTEGREQIFQEGKF